MEMMTMKAVVRKSTSIKGFAKVVVGESRIRVTFKADETDEDFSGDQYKFDRDDIPECIRKSGEYYATISGDGKILFGLRPLKGLFDTKVLRIWSRNNEPPAPQERTGKFGPYLTFSVVLAITKGEYKGMEIPVQFSYKFVETDDELTSVEISDKKGNSGERLMDFLEIAGVGDAQIKFSDNILPRLQKALLSAGAEFRTALKDGWADYFMAIDEPKATDDEEDEPKSTAKKQADDGDEDQPKAKVLKPTVEDDDDLDAPPAKKNGKRAKDPLDDLD